MNKIDSKYIVENKGFYILELRKLLGLDLYIKKGSPTDEEVNKVIKDLEKYSLIYKMLNKFPRKSSEFETEMKEVFSGEEITKINKFMNEKHEYYKDGKIFFDNKVFEDSDEFEEYIRVWI